MLVSGDRCSNFWLAEGGFELSDSPVPLPGEKIWSCTIVEDVTCSGSRLTRTCWRWPKALLLLTLAEPPPPLTAVWVSWLLLVPTTVPATKCSWICRPLMRMLFVMLTAVLRDSGVPAGLVAYEDNGKSA
nr:hypothetical protein [Tanacetum cinerariifolium]